MKYWLLSLLIALLTHQPLIAQSVPAGTDPFCPETAAADRLYAEGSYALAADRYDALAQELETGSAPARWAELRRHDARWRDLIGRRDADQTLVDREREALEQLLKGVDRPEQQDRLWAETQEALGDFHWIGGRSWRGSGQGYYDAAFGWWARSEDLDLARARWLGLLRRIALPPWNRDLMQAGRMEIRLDESRLEQALTIAESPGDRALIAFLLGRTLLEQGQGRAQDQRGLELISRVRELGAEGGFAETALWCEAVYWEQRGAWARDEMGNLSRQPDLERALALYRTLVNQSRVGEARYRRAAEQRIEALLAVEVGVSISESFTAGQVPVLSLNWRNVSTLRGRVVPLELVQDLEFDAKQVGPDGLLENLAINRREPSARFEVTPPPVRPHAAGAQSYKLNELFPKSLPAGAYLVEIEAGGKTARELLIITDQVALVECAPGEILIWVVDRAKGAPRAGIPVQAWAYFNSSSKRHWKRFQGSTDAQGLARFADQALDQSLDLVLATGSGGSQTLTVSRSGGYRIEQGWRLLVATDRPAYRPGQTVAWQVTARRHTGLEYTTPVKERIQYTINDPRGEILAEGTLELSEFGTANAEQVLPEIATLGGYNIAFKQEDGNWIGNQQLFQLEEYKLPEFEVSVAVAKDPTGLPKVYVLGDEVEARISARTYFGAAVAGGAVEVIVRRKPLYTNIEPRRPFDWFVKELESAGGRDYGYGWQPQEEVLRRSLVLDGEGQVSLAFPTPFGDSQEWEYLIEARVVDAARREVTGTGSVRVRRQAYQVALWSKSRIVSPGKAADLELRAEDGNGNPAAVAGRLTLERARWVEVWRDPLGKDHSGVELRALREAPGGLLPGWYPLTREYRFETIATQELSLDAKGQGGWRPNLPAAGTYVVRWLSDDPRSGPVRAETWIYAANADTRGLDLADQGLSLVLDAESLAEGEEAVLLVLSDANPGHALLTVAAERLIEARVLELAGPAKLVRIPLDQRHVPNVYVSAARVRDGQVLRADAELVVAPTKHFLNVKQHFDREVYRPGQTGQLELTVTDRDGQPVQGELNVAVYDAAVAAIAPERRADPRSFFYAHRRWSLLNHGASSADRPFHREQSLPDGEVVLGGQTDFDEAKLEQLEQLGYLGADSRQAGMKAKAGRSLRAMARAEAAAPASNAAMEGLADAVSAPRQSAPVGGVGGDDPAVVVRSDFRETALWASSLKTDSEGKARVEVPFSESTTRWNLSVGATTLGADFGDLRASPARTSLPLVARLAQPRFLVVGDRCSVAGLVTNNTAEPLRARLLLRVSGAELLDGDTQGSENSAVVELEVAPGETARHEWRLAARASGTLKLVLEATSKEFSDGLERSLPIEDHGILVLETVAGRLDLGEFTQLIQVDDARPGTVEIEVRATPEPALAALDALPYLTHFPYGCLEQTLSRFVPTAVAMRSLVRLGLTAEQVASASFGGIERAFASRTQPLGIEDYANWQRAAKEGLDKVLAWQSSNGSWSWWPGGPEDRWMSAYAAWSLCLAKGAGLEVPEGALQNAWQYLDNRLIETDTEPDLAGWMLFALVELDRTLSQAPSEHFQTAYRAALASRAIESASLRACLLIAAKHLGKADDVRILLDNLNNGALWDRDPAAGQLGQQQGIRAGARLERVHWGQSGLCWRWSNSAVESTSLTLLALLEVAPESELVEPALQWLVLNRRAGQWRSTRETAFAVLALTKRLERTGGAAAQVGYRILIDGQSVATVEPGADVLGSVAHAELTGLDGGDHQVELVRTAGEGPLYWSIGTRRFSIREPIQAAASELFIERQYYRLVPKETLLAGRLFERQPLVSGDTVESGDRIEVVLLIEPKADLEYLMVEDLKPAGLEATELVSGGPYYAARLRLDEIEYRFGEAPGLTILRRGDGALRPAGSYTGEQRFCYRELRDRKIALFIDRLPEGLWELRYTLRAETPGTFHGLPAIGQAMYVPEIRGNCAEQILSVVDKAE